MGVAGGVGGEREDWKDKGNDGDDDAKEMGAARSFVSISSEKETKDPLRLSLGDDMMDPDPERGVGEEGGECGGRRNRDADDKEETNAALSIVSFSSEKETKKSWPPPLLYL